MKKAFLLLGFPFLLAGKCGADKEKKQEQGNGENAAVPACVQKLNDDAGKETPPTTPIKVEEYTYNGKKVYLFTADCCDFYNIAYDENCTRLCAPSGGFTGGGDGKCRDFDSLAKPVKIIWKKKTE